MVRRRAKAIAKVPELSRTAIALLLLLASFAGQTLALDPSQLFSCYLRTHFSDDDGLPSSVVHDIVQSPVLQRADDILLVGEASNGQEAIASFRIHRPDVTLMDLQMPVMNGIDAILAIRAEFPSARFAVLTTYDGDVQALRALKAGATGYLLKSMLREELIDTIRTIHAGRRRIPSEIAAGIVEHVADDALTEREIEVLRRVATGTSNKMIASQLSLSEVTGKCHMKSILSKLSANDRTHAVTIATKRGFLDG